jgi:hypothetical protein
MIEIPSEYAGDPDGELTSSLPYFCFYCEWEAEARKEAGYYPCPDGCGNYSNGKPIEGDIHFPCVYDTTEERHLNNILRGKDKL